MALCILPSNSTIFVIMTPCIVKNNCQRNSAEKLLYFLSIAHYLFNLFKLNFQLGTRSKIRGDRVVSHCGGEILSINVQVSERIKSCVSL